jgi:hypothetical protein
VSRTGTDRILSFVKQARSNRTFRKFKFLLTAGLTLAFIAPAAAQQPSMQVPHNGSLMSLEVLPDQNVVIRYVQLAPRLSGFVGPGMVLLEGHWDNRTLYARAYVFTRKCGSFPYHVEGGVSRDGSLVLEGASPYVVEGCWVYGYSWQSSDAHLVFTKVASEPLPPPAMGER